ncbi:hypothetical protein [Nocardia transvalensis]|uniref:hypothetical protein n=1 Tax=Nocardia transvalensis TaxID=37333 RepID=UPI001895AD97|nr:hypothetical protein [Nocardia transvalensis]MBF6331804.1 hypothetical protein [Nocardia transvalensis]
MPASSSNTPTDTAHGWGWLTPTDPVPLPHDPPEHPVLPDGGEWRWLPEPTAQPTELPERARDSRWRLPRRGWIALAAVLTGCTALVIIGAMATRHQDAPVAIPTLTAAPPPTTTPAATACAGLTGSTVTDGAGNTDTIAGVIAAFEFAYYRTRSADAAMRLLAPETGIVAESLAAGIASIPAGTSHCVAITLISDNTADVHVVELHPDRSRMDYLQVINTRRTDTGQQLITNIQKAG